MKPQKFTVVVPKLFTNAERHVAQETRTFFVWEQGEGSKYTHTIDQEANYSKDLISDRFQL